MSKRWSMVSAVSASHCQALLRELVCGFRSVKTVVFDNSQKQRRTPSYCDIMRPYLEYAMEANALNLRADINQLKRVLEFVGRPMIDRECYQLTMSTFFVS